jgi:hypothetical protein
MLDVTARRVVGLLLAGVLVAACGSDDGAGVRNVDGQAAGGSGSGSGTGSAGGSGTGPGAAGAGPICEPGSTPGARVDVRLDEWSIAPKPASVKAGTVRFRVRDAGEKEHELLVIKAASPSSLPVGSDGAIEEARLDRGSRVAKIGPVAAGGSCSGRLTLPKGSYVLVCNIVGTGSGGTEAHYDKGMVNLFSVT